MKYAVITIFEGYDSDDEQGRTIMFGVNGWVKDPDVHYRGMAPSADEPEDGFHLDFDSTDDAAMVSNIKQGLINKYRPQCERLEYRECGKEVEIYR